ncbi:hypothetical protein LV779_28465 [Streptomyces thinghirensis]|nr:hypothetical protein [Streptomyces thinghirensis]
MAPRLALISCGEDNTYGHPAPAPSRRCAPRGATVLRTDRDGALAVAGTGRALRVARDWRAWMQHRSTPTSAVWEPSTRRGPPPTPCASCTFAIC